MKKWPLGIAILLFWLALAVYLPPYRQFFIGDDYVQLERASVFLDRPWQAYQMFSPFWTDWYYRPVQNLWFLLNRLLFGLTPLGFYYTLAGTHLLTGAVFYALLRRARVGTGVALGLLALFLVNARHQDVVSWLSSVAIIGAAWLSLGAAACYLVYLQRPGRNNWLWATAGLALAALVTHEEGVLLPAFLLFIHFLGRYKSKRWLTRPEQFTFVLLFALCLVYLFFQFTRTNTNISVQESSYQAALNPFKIAHYLALVFRNWTTLSNVSWGISLFNKLAAIPLAELLFVLALLYLLGSWFRQGNWLVRGGLFWAFTHLAFIYLALYSQRPEFFAGRHLYSGWAGLLLAVGGGVMDQQRGRLFRPGLIIPLLTLWLAWQVILVNRADSVWLSNAQQEAQVERQMKSLLPAVTPQTAVFARQFILSPTYFRAVAAVWYNQVGLQGGSFAVLRNSPEVTRQDFVFDYEDGQLFNLMPELQAHDTTIFLWRFPPIATLWRPDGTFSPLTSYQTEEVVGPAGDRRFAIVTPVRKDGLVSLEYVVVVPAGSQLTFALWGAGQVQIEEEMALVGSGRDNWQEFTVEMARYWGQQVTIRLQVPAGAEGNSYWANPRFTIDK